MVEVCLILSIGGVLLAAGIPTFVERLRVSRIAEAPEQLQRMYLGAAAYFGTLQTLPEGRRGIGCLPPSAGPTPLEPAPDGVHVDFGDAETPGHETWQAFGFQPAEPVRYRYTFLTEQVGCDAPEPAPVPLVRFRAEGDLDADGTLSLFERTATASGETLALDPLLFVRDRIE